MQKIFLSICLLFMAAISSFSQNKNVVYDANAEVRNVGSFSKIKVSSAITLYLSQGKEQAVAVSAGDKEYTPRIKTEVNNGTLKIFVENGMWNGWNWNNRHLKAYVTFTELQMLDASGASNVQLTDPISVNDFKLELSGASAIKGDIKATNLHFELSGASSAMLNTVSPSYIIEVTGASNLKGKCSSDNMDFDISGASTVEMQGSTGNLNIVASGASDFRGYDLQTNTCKAEASGASSIKLSVTKDLDARASGASDIHFIGSGTISHIDVSGSSTVKKKS